MRKTATVAIRVHQVGQVLSVRLTQTSYLSCPGGEKVEKSNNGSFKLGSFSGVDSSGKGFPYDRLADVGCDKQGDTKPRPYPFLQGSSSRRTIRPAQRSWMMMSRQIPIPRSVARRHASNYVYNSLTDCYQHTEQFWAPLRARSLTESPTSMILVPAKSCIIRPDVTMGEYQAPLTFLCWSHDYSQPMRGSADSEAWYRSRDLTTNQEMRVLWRSITPSLWIGSCVPASILLAKTSRMAAGTPRF